MDGFVKQLIEEAQKAGGALANNPLVKAVTGQQQSTPSQPPVPAITQPMQNAPAPDLGVSPTDATSAAMPPKTFLQAQTGPGAQISAGLQDQSAPGTTAPTGPKIHSKTHTGGGFTNNPLYDSSLVIGAIGSLDNPEKSIVSKLLDLKYPIEVINKLKPNEAAQIVNEGHEFGGSNIYDNNGNVVSTQPVIGENGGQFVNQNHKPLTGGTPAKVKAKPPIEPNMSYLPPATENGVPPIGTEPPNGATGESFTNPPHEGAASPQSNYSRTFDVTDPNIHPSATDPHEDMMRNLEVDGSDIKTQQQKAQINATANGYGIKGSQTQQSGLINDAIDTLAKRAKVNILATGGTIAKSDLVNEVAKGIFKVAGQHDIDPEAVMQMAEDTVNGAYARAKGVDSSGKYATAAPDAIPGVDAQDMKTQFNSDSSSTFGKDPSTWTKAQKTARPARDAIDKLLGEQYPDAKKLNNDMSDLYNAKESLRKGSNAEGTTTKKAYMDQEKAQQKAAEDAANAPKPPRATIGKTILGSLATGTGIAALGGTTAALIGNSGQGYSAPSATLNPSFNTPNGETKQKTVNNGVNNSLNHNQSVSPNGSDVNSLVTDSNKIQPGANGYDVSNILNMKDSSGHSVVITDNELKNEQDKIKNQYDAAAANGNKPLMDQAVQDATNLKNAYDATAKTRELLTPTQQVLGQINSTLAAINEKNSPDMLDPIEGTLPGIGSVGLQSVHETVNQDYGRLISQAQTIQDAAAKLGVKINITGANNADSLRKSLSLAAQKIIANLHSQVKTSGTDTFATPPVPPGPASTNANPYAGSNIGTPGGPPALPNGGIQMSTPRTFTPIRPL